MRTPEEAEKNLDLIFGQATSGSLGSHLLRWIYEEEPGFEDYAEEYIAFGEAWQMLGNALIPEASYEKLSSVKRELLATYKDWRARELQNRADRAKEESWYAANLLGPEDWEHEFDESPRMMLLRDAHEVQEQMQREKAMKDCIKNLPPEHVPEFWEEEGHAGDPHETECD